MIHAIIFDIGGVVYLGKNYHLLAQKKLKLNSKEWKELNKISFRNKWGKGQKVEEGLRIAAKHLGITQDKLKKVYFASLRETFRLNKKLLVIIKSIRKNYKTAILSNQWAISQKALINKNITSNFDVSVFSHLVGTRKPEKKIYLIALKRLKLKPEECIFIDDLKETLIPARKLGMKTIQFRNNVQVVRDLRKLGIKI
jgi:epoxide hydrolase-like predicted phosphatase